MGGKAALVGGEKGCPGRAVLNSVAREILCFARYLWFNYSASLPNTGFSALPTPRWSLPT